MAKAYHPRCLQYVQSLLRRPLLPFGNGRMFWRIVLHDTGVWVLREGV